VCGRYASTLSPDAIRAMFSTFGNVPNVRPSWNVAPTHQAMVVHRHPDSGKRRLHLLRWGLVPHSGGDARLVLAMPCLAVGRTGWG
jgi:putative SOS response-associated peptidase YedK